MLDKLSSIATSYFRVATSLPALSAVIRGTVLLSVLGQREPGTIDVPYAAAFCIIGLWALAGALAVLLPAKAKLACWPWLVGGDLLACLCLYPLFAPARISVLGLMLLSMSTVYRSLGLRTAITCALAFLFVALLAGIYATAQWLPIVHQRDGFSEFAAFVSLAVVMVWAVDEMRVKHLLDEWEDLQVIAGEKVEGVLLHVAHKIKAASRSTQVAILWQADGDEPKFVSTQVDHGVGPDLDGLFSSFGRALTNGNGILPFDSSASGGGPARVPAREKMDHREKVGLSALGLDSGLCFSIGAEHVKGVVCIEAKDRLYFLDPSRASAIARKANVLLRRQAALEAWRAQALVDARQELARDLHDSILQTLAALRMRIATLIKGQAGAGDDALEVQLRSLEHAVASEQSRLRALLMEMGGTNPEAVGLNDILQECARSVMRNWNVQCGVTVATADVRLSKRMASEIELLFREVAANAVRHAHATHISVNAAVQDAELNLVFRDEAAGGARDPQGSSSDELKSRSLTDRLSALGGQAYSDDLARSSLLSIRIPLPTGSTIAA